MEYRTVKELCSIVADCPHSTPVWTTEGRIVIRNNNIKNGRIDFSHPSYTDQEHFEQRIRRVTPKSGDIVITREAPIGDVGMIPEGVTCCLGQRMVLLRANNEICDNYYLLYALQSRYVQHQIKWSEGTGTTVSNMRIPHLEQLKIPYPSLEDQRKIGSILRSIEEKAELNRKINNNLLDQVMAYYRHLFINESTEQSHICRADEVFDISIGKTPPRKEFHWFSEDPKNVRWVSIADMGDCGVFISDSSEYLTPEAISKFNLVRIPSNTVLLSFKLTVGRIAITDGEMTTNEAIAHFKTENENIVEYLYCYLKSFNYGNLGSTSSIATAVNSKIIKAMPFLVPSDEKLNEFHDFASPFFAQMKAIQAENRQLALLRDSLLPRLLDGELDVSEIEI